MLVTLSSSAEKQKKIVGHGNVPDEMVLDFESYYLSESQNYVVNNLLPKSIIEALNRVDKYLEQRSGEKMPEFWNDESLKVHPD